MYLVCVDGTLVSCRLSGRGCGIPDSVLSNCFGILSGGEAGAVCVLVAMDCFDVIYDGRGSLLTSVLSTESIVERDLRLALLLPNMLTDSSALVD